ncbi:MAG: alpha-glucan family phosphorylase, partial [Candidatus Pacebacteria bacterium]|nr:alpha-glucan family phosphorylase [Candidatus Paceibacterota bacterium]
MKTNTKTKPRMLFEVSWEVCNKVGGIFTVLSSKAKQMQKHYKNSYCLIGPYFDEKSRNVFKEEPIPDLYKSIYSELKNIGIVLHFGSWIIKGEPKVILIDFKNFWHNNDNVKKQMWDSFGLDSLNSAYDYDEPVLWSWTVGTLIKKISDAHKEKNIVMHAHE